MRTVSEEGPAGLASVKRRQWFLLLAYKGVPPHLVWSPELPGLFQTALQVLDGVIRAVVHQTCQQALGGENNTGRCDMVRRVIEELSLIR